MSSLPARPSLLARIDFALAPALATADEVRVECAEDGPAQLVGPGLHISFLPWRWQLARGGHRIALYSGLGIHSRRALSHPAQAGSCLRLLESFGEAFPARMATPFAVAIVDLQARTVYLATDRFSIRPLCAAAQGESVVFSDRADAVAETIGAGIDTQALFDYFVAHVIRAPRTLFRNVERLQGGHALQLAPGLRREIRYWQPRFEEAAPRPAFAALREEFRQVVRAAVAREAQDAAVGAFLSGGTDSSTVVGMLADLRPAPARAYSIGFDAQGYDEIRYARIAAQHFGARHREHYVTPDDVLRGIPLLAGHFDQPFGNSSALPALWCARMAREDGIEQLLAGDGGDELFGGNTRYARQKLFEPYARLPAALRDGLLGPWLAGDGALARLPGMRKAASYVRQARVPMPDRLRVASLMNLLGAEAVLTPEFLHEVDLDAPGRLEREIYARVEAHALVNRMLAFDWKFTLADNDLPKVLGAAGVAGLSVGFPFLDDAVVDLSLRVPPDWKVRGFTLRWFFRQALRGFLPNVILDKRKHGFGLPFGPWLAAHDGLREMAGDTFAQLARRGWVRPAFLDALLGRKLGEHPGFYGEMVWILVMLEQWLQAREAAARSAARAAA
jgi:asparagine synthase (glutamine-hydrolysing)